MKNLIGLFFILGALSAFSQNSNEELIAERHTPIIKSKTKLPKAYKKMPKVIAAAPFAVVKSDILSGFSTGNALLIAKYFPSNIEINILGKSNLYSKSQGQQVLTTFFTQNKASNFQVVHEGESNGTRYFIGTYTAATGKYRVTINVKKVGTADQITSISIES